MNFHLDKLREQFLPYPLDHIRPSNEGSFSWSAVLAQREDFLSLLPSRNAGATPASVCVVGGGIAGLVVSYELARRGMRITLLERSSRFGGRVHTMSFADGTYGEFGAMRIPVLHTAVLDYVEAFGLNTRPFVNWNPNGRFHVGGVGGLLGAADNVARGDVQIGRLSSVFQGLRKVTNRHLTAGPRSMLISILVKPLLRELTMRGGEWALFFRDREHVSDWSKVSLEDFARGSKLGLSRDDWTYLSRATGIAPLAQCSVVQFLRDMVPTILSTSMVELEHGMESLVRAFLVRLGSTRTLLDATVYRVRPTDDGAVVSWSGKEGNQTESFDYCVVTAPPDALVNIDFHSILTSDRKPLSGLLKVFRMGPLAKCLLHFSERFWEALPEPIFGGMSFTDLPSMVCWYPSDNARMVRDLGGKVSYTARAADMSRLPGVITGSYRWGDSAADLSARSLSDTIESTVLDIAAIHDMSIREVERIILDGATMYWPGGYTLTNDDARLALADSIVGSDDVPRILFAGEHMGCIHGWLVSSVLSGLAASARVVRAQGGSTTVDDALTDTSRFVSE